MDEITSSYNNGGVISPLHVNLPGYKKNEYDALNAYNTYVDKDNEIREFDTKMQDPSGKNYYLGETIKKLYEMDADPARKIFLDGYLIYMKRRGVSVSKVPVVGKLPLDLYRLYYVVQKFGGFAQVVKKRRWSRVVRDLGLPSSITSAAFTLRTQYMRLLYPYECEKKGIPSNFMYPNGYQDWIVDQNVLHEMAERKIPSEPSMTSPRRNLYERPRSVLSSTSEDNVCLKTGSRMFFSPSMIKGYSPERPTSRSRSEEFTKDAEKFYQPRSIDSTNQYKTSHDNDCKRERKDSDREVYETKFNEEVKNSEVASHVDREYYNDMRQRYYLSEQEHKENISKSRMLLEQKIRSNNGYIHNRASSPTQVRTNSPSLPEKTMHIDSYYEDMKHYNRHAKIDPRYNPYQKHYDERRKGRNGFNPPHSPLYKLSYNKPMQFSTDPSEMNITIENRTETAMALSIIINGIRYTGTLLSNVH